MTTDRTLLTHVSLFSGLGGDTLAAQWAGFETVCLVEIDLFCQKVLRKHWPSVPIVGDVRNVEEIKQVVANATSVYGEGMHIGKGQQPQTTVEGSPGGCHYDGSPVTLLTGGFPCQPVSVAGKRRGKADDRWLWPEMFAVVQALRPAWVVGENVAGIVRMGLDECLSDLEGEGYTCQAFVIPACAVNAPHRRSRVFIAAHTASQQEHTTGKSRLYPLLGSEDSDVADSEQSDNRSQEQCSETNWKNTTRPTSGVSRPNRNVTNSNPERFSEREVFGRNLQQEQQTALRDAWQEDWYAVATRFCRVDDGPAHRLDRNRVNRLKSLGNAIVPAQIFPILKAIADIEGGER